MWNNTSKGVQTKATIAVQSKRLLLELAALGIYGRNEGDVAGRFIEEALRKLTKPPRLRNRRGSELPGAKVRVTQPKLTAAARRRRGRG